MPKDFKHYLKKKTDKELIAILSTGTEVYHKEAISSVEEIIKERNLTKKGISKIKNEIRRDINKDRGRRRKIEKERKGSGLLELIFEILLSGH